MTWLSLLSTVLQLDVNVSLADPIALLGGALGAFLTTFVVGAILVALAPAYTDRMTAVVVEDPVGSGVYGLFFLVALVVVTVALVLSVVGILVALPLAVVAGVTWAVGSAVAFLAIGERLVGDAEGKLRPLAVGAAINGGLALSGVGGLLSFAVGAAGFGAVLRDWLE